MSAFSFQGIVKLAPRLSNGQPGVWFDFGDASLFQIAFSEDTVERSEHRTGSRLPYRKLTKSQGGVLTIKGDEFNTKNMAMACKSTAATVAAGSPVTGYAFPTGLAVGDIVTIPTRNATSVTIKDSTGSPKTLTLGTNYSIDAFSGEITILDITTGGAFVQPFKADYTPGAYTAIGAFTAPPNAEWYARITGINTDTNKRGVGEVFRIRIPPTKLLAMINEEWQDNEFDCQILADLNRSSSDPFGMFFGWTDGP